MALLDSSFTFFTTEYEITLVGWNQAAVMPHYHHGSTSAIDIMWHVVSNKLKASKFFKVYQNCNITSIFKKKENRSFFIM
jgi:hypothetical protein